MKNKNSVITGMLIVAFLLLLVGTVAYFRRTVNGTITGNTGNLVLIVNEANAALNESFAVSLNEGLERPYVMPGDSGTFDINIDATGSTRDVLVNVTISRDDMPDNLKFYLDEDYTTLFKNELILLKYSDSMTATIPVYWYWDGEVDDVNDTLFIGKTAIATVNASAIIYQTPTFADVLADNEANGAALDTNVDFGAIASSTNGNGLMMMSSTVNDPYPIVYYRGDVVNNNVIFGDMCWLIVRTTETGGIKLTYNGPVNDDGSCNNYSGVGGATVDFAGSDYYGNIFIYSYFNEFIHIGGTETNSAPSILYESYMFDKSKSFYNSVNNNTVTEIDKYSKYLNDFTLDSETGHHKQNKNDSLAKEKIDSWYVANILGKDFERLVEDTVWCNDRSITSSTYSLSNYTNNSDTFYFSARTRLNESSTVNPSLYCNRDVDSFTVSRLNGNGDLTYPIGTLTADEVALAGQANGSSTDLCYLNVLNSSPFWSMSPVSVSSGISNIYYYNFTYLGSATAATFYIRPTISIGRNARIVDGNGSFETPYIIG